MEIKVRSYNYDLYTDAAAESELVKRVACVLYGINDRITT